MRAFERFCEFLGSVAGDLALTIGAFGGVYIAGGILPRFKEAFAASAFRAAFREQGALRLDARQNADLAHPRGIAGLDRARQYADGVKVVSKVK